MKGVEFECTSFVAETLPSGRIRIKTSDATPSDEIWSKNECADRLNVTTRTLGEYMRHRIDPIPYSKIGKHPRFRRKSVEEWLERNTLRRRVSSFVI